MEAPLAQRVRAAHMLAILLWLQGAAALAGVGVSFAEDAVGIGLMLAIGGALGLVAGFMEWNRHVRGEQLAGLAFVWNMLMCIIVLVLGWWYYVPLLGIITLLVMLTLMQRIAMRSESRHQAHGH